MSSSKYSLRILLEDLQVSNFLLEEKSSAKSGASKFKGVYTEYACADKLAKHLDLDVTDATGKKINPKKIAAAEKKKYDANRGKDKTIPVMEKSDMNGKNPADNQFEVFKKAIEDVKTREKEAGVGSFADCLKRGDARIECVGQSPGKEIAQEDIRIRWPLKGDNPNYLLFTAKAAGSSLTKATSTPGQFSMALAEGATSNMVQQVFDFIETQSKSEPNKSTLLAVKAEYGLSATDHLKKANGSLNRELPNSKILFPAMSSLLADAIIKQITSWSPETAAAQMKVAFTKYYKNSTPEKMATMAAKPPPYYYGIKHGRGASRLVKMSEMHNAFLSALGDVLTNGGGSLGYVVPKAGAKTITITHNNETVLKFGVDCNIKSKKFNLTIALGLPSKKRVSATTFTGKGTVSAEDAAFELDSKELKDVADASVKSVSEALKRFKGKKSENPLTRALANATKGNNTNFFGPGYEKLFLLNKSIFDDVGVRFTILKNNGRLNITEQKNLAEELVRMNPDAYAKTVGAKVSNRKENAKKPVLIIKKGGGLDEMQIVNDLVAAAAKIGFLTINESTTQDSPLIIERWSRLAGLIK